MPTVTLPVVGTIERRYVVIGGATVVVIVGYVWWRRRTRPPTLDTATGSLGGDTGYVNPNPGAVGGGEVVDTTGGTAILTNDQWAQLAATRLEGLFDPQYVIVTLGKYLDGQPLSQDEANLVRAAWAAAGHPPVGNPQIILATSSSTPGGTSVLPPPAPSPDMPKPAPRPGPPRRYALVHKYPGPWSTLSDIAARTNRSVTQLAQWNSIANPNLIYPNQKVWVDPPGSYNGSTKIN